MACYYTLLCLKTDFRFHSTHMFFPCRVNIISIVTARKRSLGQGNIFTPVCHSVNRGGGIPACIAGGIPTCLAAGGCAIRACLAAGGVPDPGDLLLGGSAPGGGVSGGDQPDGYCCGRYASYWNAFLLLILSLPHSNALEVNGQTDKA